MSHDAEYAQKRHLEEKQRNWDAESLASRLSSLTERIDGLEEVLRDIQRDVQGIKAVLSTR